MDNYINSWFKRNSLALLSNTGGSFKLFQQDEDHMRMRLALEHLRDKVQKDKIFNMESL